MHPARAPWPTVAFGLALGLWAAAGALAQDRVPHWWEGVFPIDGGTVLTLGADWGSEVRSGPEGEIRHGVRVPLVVDPGGDRVEMTIDATPDYATRWTLARSGSEVVIERWVRRGNDRAAWERERSVRVPLPE